MKRRLLSVFLSLALIVGLLPETAWAADATSGSCGTNTTWRFEESTGTLTIGGTGATDDYAYSWGSNAPWAAYQDDIRSVYIESGVTRIGEGAFGGDMGANCYENLVAATLPNTLESIGTYAFAGSSLSSINLPSNLKTIEDGAFNYTKLTMVSLPSSLTTIGSGAFPDTLISVRIPASVTKIGGGAFGSSTSIIVDTGNRSYVAEDNVLYNIGKTEIICIGSLNATYYTIPATVKTVDLSEFWYAPNLEKITIPAGVELTNYLCPPEVSIPDVPKSLALYFYGNAPSELDNGVGTLRNGEWAGINVYYVLGTSGWEEYLQRDYSDSLGVPYMTFATWTPGDATFPSVQKLYPANGATEVGYGANSPTRFQITFDREIANDGSIAQDDLSKPGAFSVYRASDDQPVYQSTQYSTYNFLIVYQQENILSISSTELDPGTEYYITLDAGIVQFKDGSTNSIIKKGDWVFVTKEYISPQNDNTPIVIIPGVMGSKLYDENGKVVWGEGLTAGTQNGSKLAGNLHASGLIKEPKLDVINREYGSIDSAKNLVDFLCNNYLDRDVYFYSYDWRQSNADSATELANSLKKLDIEKVIFVCHSMGGIVLSHYIEQNGTSTIEKAITLGTPYEGAPKLLQAVLTTTVVGIGVGDFLLSITGLSRDIKTGFKGVAELAPTLGYAEKSGEIYYTKVKAIQAMNSIEWSSSVNDYENALRSIYGVAYSSVRDAQNRVKTSVQTLLNMDNAYFAIGDARPTMTEVRLTDYNGKINYLDCNYGSGDGTVPLLSGNMLLNRCPTRAAYFDLDHGGLAGDIDKKKDAAEWEREKQWIASIIGEKTTSDVRIVPIGMGEHVVMRVACPVDVKIERNGEVLTNIPSEFCDEADFGRMDLLGENGDIKMFCLDKDTYEVLLNGTDVGAMDYTVRFYSADEELEDERTFQGVPITASTKISTNTTEDGTTELGVDEDGNGMVDAIWQAGKDETTTGPIDGYVVSFNANGGTTSKKFASVGQDGKLVDLPTAVQTNYSFDGWFTEAVGGIPITSNTEFLENTIIYAHWTYNASSTPSITNPSTPGSSWNPGTTNSTNTVTIPSVTGGKVSANPSSPKAGQSVTITATPNSGYELTSLAVTSSDGKNVELSNAGNNKYTFIMPDGKVTVNAVFSKTWSNPFSDVDESAWYYDAIKFANQNGLMDGVGNGLFAPNANLSRAMLAQILYNKEGRPIVTATSSFSDVISGAWYANAVTWAATKNIVGGYGNGLFGPSDDITREQFAVILYRYAGSPIPPNLLLDFTDAYKVSNWAQDAIRWAVDQGILKGKGNGILDPTGKATRAEAAQMLKNYFGQ